MYFSTIITVAAILVLLMMPVIFALMSAMIRINMRNDERSKRGGEKGEVYFCECRTCRTRDAYSWNIFEIDASGIMGTYVDYSRNSRNVRVQ